MSLCPPPRNAICLASDQNYIDYTYVTVLSIAEHASPAQHYEVVILSSGVLEYKKKIFYRLNSENFIVRFIDMDEYVDKIIGFTGNNFVAYDNNLSSSINGNKTVFTVTFKKSNFPIL